MDLLILIIVAVVTLLLGMAVGYSVANAKHKSERGMHVAKTLHIARELIYSEMSSQEFHMAVMSVVHPDAIPNQGYQMINRPTPQMEIDADAWLAQQCPNQFGQQFVPPQDRRRPRS